MMGRLYGGDERIEETVDLPVAILPVRPRRSMIAICDLALTGFSRY
jgi:hypothetical protein